MKGTSRPKPRYACLAAIEHFPNRETAIRRLIERDETFRELCEELSETKEVLAGHSTPPAADSQGRRDDQLERVGCLVGEILAALLAQEQPPSRNAEMRPAGSRPIQFS